MTTATAPLAAADEGNEVPLGKRDPRYRFFEMIPAVFSYGNLAAVVVLSLIHPTWGALWVLVIVAYMFIRGCLLYTSDAADDTR